MQQHALAINDLVEAAHTLLRVGLRGRNHGQSIISAMAVFSGMGLRRGLRHRLAGFGLRRFISGFLLSHK